MGEEGLKDKLEVGPKYKDHETVRASVASPLALFQSDSPFILCLICSCARSTVGKPKRNATSPSGGLSMPKGISHSPLTLRLSPLRPRRLPAPVAPARTPGPHESALSNPRDLLCRIPSRCVLVDSAHGGACRMYLPLMQKPPQMGLGSATNLTVLGRMTGRPRGGKLGGTILGTLTHQYSPTTYLEVSTAFQPSFSH